MAFNLLLLINGLTGYSLQYAFMNTCGDYALVNGAFN